jgi:GTP cyclohydrolase II
VDEVRVHPEVLAGDPFAAAAHDHDDTVEAHYASLEREPEACLCYDGWHFLGHVVELPDGDEEIEYIRVRCRRCREA